MREDSFSEHRRSAVRMRREYRHGVDHAFFVAAVTRSKSVSSSLELYTLTRRCFSAGGISCSASLPATLYTSVPTTATVARSARKNNSGLYLDHTHVEIFARRGSMADRFVISFRAALVFSTLLTNKDRKFD